MAKTTFGVEPGKLELFLFVPLRPSVMSARPSDCPAGICGRFDGGLGISLLEAAMEVKEDSAPSTKCRLTVDTL